MAHYNVFRHHLAIKFPAYGHALWEPDPGNLYPAVEIGDVGYICEGKFHRLFNVLLPAKHPSHRNLGVPEYHEQLTLNMEDHINIGKLSANNFCSAKVTSLPVSERLAQGPDDIAKVSFSCPMKEGAVLCLPIQAKGENTIATADFGKWLLRHIDRWFAWARQLGLGIDRMEDIILVTGTHCSRSWTNVVFPGGQDDAHALFGAKVDHHGDIVAINWQISHEHNRGAVLNCGPDGRDLPEDQCIFVRGFRATRKLKILPPRLKGAADPNTDPEGHDEEPGAELIPIPAVLEYRDPLHILIEYIAQEAPHNCDMVLIHDDDLVPLDGIFDSTLLEAPQLDVVLSHIRNLKPTLHVNRIEMSSFLSSVRNSASVDTESAWVATLSNVFEKQYSSSTPSASQSLHIKMPTAPRQLSKSHASLRDDLLERLASAASLTKQNVAGSPDTLPGFVTDRPVSAQRLGSAKQPEPGPLQSPLLLSYGESPSNDLSSHGSSKNRPHPKAGSSVQIVSSLIQATRNVKIYRSQCNELSQRCLDLVSAMQEHSPELEGPLAQQAVDEVERVLIRILKRVAKWAELGKMRSFVKQTDIKRELEESYHELTTLAIRFNNALHLDAISRHQELEEIRRRDHNELIEMITRVLQDNKPLKTTLASGTPEDARSVVKAIEQELTKADFEETQERELQEDFSELRRWVEKLPPMVDLTGKVFRTSVHPLATGGSQDIYTGESTGQEVVLAYPRDQTRAAQERFQRQVEMWRSLRHPNVLQFLGIAYIDNFVCSVSPCMEFGNVMQYLKIHPEAPRILLLSEIASGTEYLHSRGITHGDLRGTNVLLSRDGHACLADFGCARIEEVQVEATEALTYGSPRWLAPELIQSYYVPTTRSTDVWSFGMLCIEIFTDNIPFSDIQNDIYVPIVIRDGSLPTRPEEDVTANGLSDAMWDLMNRCWRREPESRPKMPEIREAIQYMLPTHLASQTVWSPLILQKSSSASSNEASLLMEKLHNTYLSNPDDAGKPPRVGSTFTGSRHTDTNPSTSLLDAATRDAL